MENFNRIQKYLHNEMSPEERSSFEKEVQANEALAMELELQRFELETIEQLEEDSLREKANQLKKQLKEKNNDVPHPIKKRSDNQRILLWAVAASIALLAGYFILRPMSNSNSIQITETYTEARLNFGNGNVRNDNSQKETFPSKFIEILKNRDKDKMDEAIEYFSNFSSNNKNANNQALLNLGHAYLLDNQLKKSIQTFSEVLITSELTSYQREEAQLFYALALFSDSQKDEAISILEKLSQEGENFEVLAQKLVKRIK